MTTTLLRDIVEPTLFAQYIQEQMVEKNALIQSGIITIDPVLDALANAGGRTVNMPFFQDLSGDDEIPSSSNSTTTNELTIGGIGTGKDIAVIHMRDKAFGSEDLAADFAGADPMMAIGNRFADWWLKKEQALLIKSLEGVFSANLASNSGDLINDISTGAGSSATASQLISAGAIVDTVAKLGDSHEDLAAIAVHSVPYFRMVKQDLIEFIPDSQGRLNIPTYLGKRVIVDDTCPRASAATSGLLYTTYIFGLGAFARGEGQRVTPVEVGRKELAGQDFIINRRLFLLHPRGIRFNSKSVAGVAPTNAECSQASNWTRVYEKKNIKIVSLVTNG